MKAATVLLALWSPAIAAAGSGSPECQCLSDSSDTYDQVREQLEAAGYPADHGTGGCAAYDADMAASGCESNEMAYCLNPWCFVDMALCPIDVDLCEEAGGVEGSDTSPFCRSRPAVHSSIANVSAYYSYETCGSMNMYNTNLSRLFMPVAGHVVKIATDDSFPPWVLKRTSLSGVEEWGGASYDFFVSALDAFVPKPALKISSGWATQSSRKKFGNSYTACVHDVAVGNFDVCVGDFWITPERNQLATFLPAVRQDFLYLVVPAKIEDVTFWTRLQRPFLPFTPDGWLGVAAFLCGMSVLLWLVRLSEQSAESEGGCRAEWSWNLSELGRFHFNVWHDFLLGESSHEPEKGPAQKLFSLAFAFFILITLASYTASLASMLVVQQHTVGTINSLDDAVAQAIPVCVPTVVFPTFRKVFPHATFVEVDGYSPRVILSGHCGAMVLSQALINNMHAGMFVREDCEAVASGAMSESEAHCERKNDCSFQRVGDILWSTPLSFPVSDKLAHSMSWAFTLALSRGLMEEKKRLNAADFPKSQCKTVKARTRDGLSLADLSGTIFISIFLVLLGIGCLAAMGLRRLLRRPSSRSSPKDSSKSTAPQECPSHGQMQEKPELGYNSVV